MWSRWPNELTYDTISSLPFVPAGPLSVVELQGPDISLCHLDPVTKTYTTNSECWQYGSIEIPLGPVCNVSGPYTFTFDSDCFSGTGNGNNCTGTKLSANAIIEGVDLCTSLLATASNVTGNLTVDKPGGYFFGDSITLNATFKSPDVPLFETRLMSAEVIIAKFNKNPILLYAHSEGNVLLGTNTNFTITQNGSVSPYEVLMRLTPNMKPTFEEGAFLTTEDFDTADNSFSFRLRFRVFFDATSADRNSTTRRRRALFRDLAVNSHTLQRRLTPTLGSIQELQVGIQSNMQVPNRAEVLDTHPDMVPAGTLPPEGNNSGQSAVTPVWIYAVAAVAGLVIVAGIGACVWFCCMKRRRSSGPEDEFGETQGLVQGANPAGFSPDSFAVPTPDWTKSTWNVGGIPDVGKLFGPEMGFSGAPSYSSAFGSSAGYDAPGVNVASMFGETPPQSMKEKRRNRR